MPIAGPAIASAILAANPTLVGTAWFQTAAGIGMGVSQWAVIPANIVLVGSVAGAVGGGVVTGKYTLNPSPLPVSATVAAVGLLGLEASQVALAVGLGVGFSLNASAGYVGTSVGAIGADVSKVTFVNPISLIALITANLASQGIVGPLAAQLSTGLGNGIAAMVLTGGGIGVATGIPGPAPGIGVSRSSLF